MTLFKKVFQNQSRPASEDEALDEEALRAAFMEMDAQRDPLVLDPFEHEVKEHEPEDISATESADDIGETSPEKTEASEAKVEEVNTADAEPFDGSEMDVEANDANDAEGHVGFQSDEEIAACLDRALAAEPAHGAKEAEEAAERTERLTDTAPAVSDAGEQSLPETEGAAEETEKKAAPATDVNAYALEQLAALEAMDDSSVAELRHVSAETETEPVAEVSLSAVPAPATGRAGRRAGRVKTRLLGFNRGGEEDADPFGRTPETTATAQREKFPVGWLVIVEGPGVGYSFSIFTGASMIGRGEDQVIRLDFGDNSISRQNHAAIAYDEEQNKFYIGHGGKSNIIRRNARPVLTTEELHHADLIRIGETTLRFVALCGSDFQWSGVETGNAAGV